MIDRYFRRDPGGAKVVLPDISEPRQTAGEVQGQARPAGAPPRLHRRLARAGARHAPNGMRWACSTRSWSRARTAGSTRSWSARRGIAGGVQGGINIGLGNMYNYRGPMLWTVAFIHDPAKSREEITAALDSVIEDVRDEAGERRGARAGADQDPLQPLQSRRSRRPASGSSTCSPSARCGRTIPNWVNRLEAGFDRVTPGASARHRAGISAADQPLDPPRPAGPARGRRHHGSFEMIRRLLAALAAAALGFAAAPLAAQPQIRLSADAGGRHAQAVHRPGVGDLPARQRDAGDPHPLRPGAQGDGAASGSMRAASTRARTSAWQRSPRRCSARAPAGAPAPTSPSRGRRWAATSTSARAPTRPSSILNVLSEHADDAVRLIADVGRRPDFPASEFERVRQSYAPQRRRRQVAAPVGRRRRPRRGLLRAAAIPTAASSRPTPSSRAIRSTTCAASTRPISARGGPGSRRRPVRRGGGQGGDRAGLRRLGRRARSGSACRPQPQPGPKVILVDRPGRAAIDPAPRLPGAGRRAPEDIGFRVTNALLGGSFTSRITANIREQKGYTYSPFSGGHLQSGRGAVGVRRRRHHRRHRRRL